jgi:phage gp36-like protein
MMAYVSVADLVTRYGEGYVTASCDRDQDGAADTSALETALDEASARIDAFVGARYPVPVSPVPAVLASVCGDIGIYLASTDPLALTDDKRARYEDALRFLRDIARGDATLGQEADPPPTTRVLYSTNERVFTRTLMDGL